MKNVNRADTGGQQLAGRRVTIFWQRTGLYTGFFASLAGVYFSGRWIMNLPSSGPGPDLRQLILLLGSLVPAFILGWLINFYNMSHLICPTCRQRITLLAQFCKSCGSPLWNVRAKDSLGSLDSVLGSESLANDRSYRGLSLIVVLGLCAWTAYDVARFRWWAVLFAVVFFILWVYRYWLRCPLCHHYAGVRNNLTGNTRVGYWARDVPFILLGALFKLLARNRVDYCQACGAKLTAGANAVGRSLIS